jgi:hypothetical protein
LIARDRETVRAVASVRHERSARVDGTERRAIRPDDRDDAGACPADRLSRRIEDVDAEDRTDTQRLGGAYLSRALSVRARRGVEQESE